MTAISTSIVMAKRVAPHTNASKYLDRGQRSVQYMQLLLNKVADATNLEAALAKHDFESVDLSSLVLNRIHEFCTDTPSQVFTSDIERDVQILGQGDSLVQMLDKLLNNAIEHSRPGFPIHVTLQDHVGSCLITITDIGDPLPPSTAKIFEPFVTLKTTQPGSANLGQSFVDFEGVPGARGLSRGRWECLRKERKSGLFAPQTATLGRRTGCFSGLKFTG